MPILNSVFNLQLEISNILKLEAIENDYPVVGSIKFNVWYDSPPSGKFDLLNRDLVVDGDYTVPDDGIQALSEWIVSFLREELIYASFDLGECFSFELKHSLDKGYIDFVTWVNATAWEDTHVDKDAVGYRFTVTPMILQTFASELKDDWKKRNTMKV